jgi:hypothetical protein
MHREHLNVEQLCPVRLGRSGMIVSRMMIVASAGDAMRIARRMVCAEL